MTAVLSDIEKFEKGFAEELDGWMWNFLQPLEFVCKKAVDGEIDFTLDPDSIEYKNLVLALATEFYTDPEDFLDLEAIGLAINSIALLASGDREEIENQLLVYFKEYDFGGLSIKRIVTMFKGKPIEVAKAFANSLHGTGSLPYPHS